MPTSFTYREAAAAAAAAASIYVKQYLLHIYAVLAAGGLAPPSNSLAEPADCENFYFHSFFHALNSWTLGL